MINVSNIHTHLRKSHTYGRGGKKVVREKQDIGYYVLYLKQTNRNLCALILRFLKLWHNRSVYISDYDFQDTSTDVISFLFAQKGRAQIHTSPPPASLAHSLLNSPSAPALQSPNWRSIDIIEELDELGRGAYGVVCKARTTQNVFVAIKTAIESPDQLIHEAEIVEALQHQNVTQLFALKRNPVRLIMEFIDGGDVFSWLQDQSTRVQNVVVDGNVLMKIAKNIAAGMAYLSDRRIIHRDLAARNCLIDSTLKAKISDFGLAAKLPGEADEIKEEMPIPIRWMPPEAIKSYRFSLATDVYSYGIFVWELFTLASYRPYPVTYFFQFFIQLRVG